MISAIILLLAVLTAGAIVGIFAAALVELHAVDDCVPHNTRTELFGSHSVFSAERS